MVIKGRCQRVAYKINSNGPIDMKHLTTYLAYLGFVATQVYQEWCKLRSSLPAKPYDRPKLRKRIPQYQTAWLSESESRALLRPEYTPMCAVSVKYLDLYVDWWRGSNEWLSVNVSDCRQHVQTTYYALTLFIICYSNRQKKNYTLYTVEEN